MADDEKSKDAEQDKPKKGKKRPVEKPVGRTHMQRGVEKRG